MTNLFKKKRREDDIKKTQIWKTTQLFIGVKSTRNINITAWKWSRNIALETGRVILPTDTGFNDPIPPLGDNEILTMLEKFLNHQVLWQYGITEAIRNLGFYLSPFPKNMLMGY